MSLLCLYQPKEIGKEIQYLTHYLGHYFSLLLFTSLYWYFHVLHKGGEACQNLFTFGCVGIFPIQTSLYLVEKPLCNSIYQDFSLILDKLLRVLKETRMYRYLLVYVPT